MTEESKDWASDEGLEELKEIYAEHVKARGAYEPALPNMASAQERQAILSKHQEGGIKALTGYLGAAYEAVPQLIEALEEARAFANGTNGELIGIIRSITDRAGADGVPFLDDAVRRIVQERDEAKKALEDVGEVIRANRG